MNTLDIIFLIVVGVTTAYGIWKGMISQVLSIAGIVVGYILASHYYIIVAEKLKFTDPTLGKILSFVIIFIACIIAAAILSWLLNKVFKLPGLGMINSFLGGIVGFAKGLLLVIVATILLVATLSQGSPIMTTSITLPYVLRIMKSAESWIPRDMKDQFQKKLDSVSKDAAPEPAVKPAPKQKK
jgi:membrane protein required for colicin V production